MQMPTNDTIDSQGDFEDDDEEEEAQNRQKIIESVQYSERSENSQRDDKRSPQNKDKLGSLDLAN